jgi:Protein of unknown function (DUF507)
MTRRSGIRFGEFASVSYASFIRLGNEIIATVGSGTCESDPPEERSGELRSDPKATSCYTLCFKTEPRTYRIRYPHMLLSKEYVGYLAREVTKKLIAAKAIETTAVPKVTERVHAALLEELTLEDRINDEVRVILEAYSDEMNKTGANYQEMFRKVKSELVRKYKAVL